MTLNLKDFELPKSEDELFALLDKQIEEETDERRKLQMMDKRDAMQAFRSISSRRETNHERITACTTAAAAMLCAETIVGVPKSKRELVYIAVLTQFKSVFDSSFEALTEQVG